MPTPHTVYQLVRCGPADVRKELEIIGSLVDEWNSTHDGDRDTYNFLKHSHWSTDAAPDMSDRPQSVINRQIIDGADIVVAVFWTRFGTPTGKADSGTEEEILRAIKKKKRVMLYFSDLEGPQIVSDEKQYQKVCAFREQMSPKGLYWTFKSRAEFQDIFRRHLAKVMTELTTPRLRKANVSKSTEALPAKVIPISAHPIPTAAVNVGRDNHGSIEINFTQKQSKQPRGYSPNSIGADANRKNYVDYLCGLWADYMSNTGASQEQLLGRIGKNIKTKFRLRSRTRNDLSINRFDDLVSFLVNEKLPKTPVGKKHVKRGTRLCRTFEEYCCGAM